MEEVEGMGSLVYGIFRLLVESFQQKEVLDPIHKARILDYEKLKLSQRRHSRLLDIRKRV